MSGGSKEHNLIAGNIYSRFRSHLRGGSCSVFMADMKVNIQLNSRHSKNIYYYPDVVVSCDSDDKDRFSLNYPCLIIEVLSPSTEITDKREKLVNHRNLDK
jgi:Uma2 family endonuclease